MTFLQSLAARHEPETGGRTILKAGFGAFFAILLLGLLLDLTGLPLLIAPFGASTILLFGHPNGTLAQPMNVLGGYLIAACSASAAAAIFPGALWATAVSIASALMLMSAFRVTHPPAGAIPLIVFAEPTHVVELVLAVAVGSTALIALALVYHRLPPRRCYPRPIRVDSASVPTMLSAEYDTVVGD